MKTRNKIILTAVILVLVVGLIITFGQQKHYFQRSCFR